MKVLTTEQEQVLEQLLQYAGSSGVLEAAFRRVRAEKGGKASLDDLLSQIAAIKEEVDRKAHAPAG